MSKLSLLVWWKGGWQKGRGKDPRVPIIDIHLIFLFPVSVCTASTAKKKKSMKIRERKGEKGRIG